ncbi:MAG: methionyl-tRNA formyltransferase [Ignavibacteriaceae bacterium]|nr:methionyl-tRNA formyltransferase [Ignavibacteriaceae bacterium]
MKIIFFGTPDFAIPSLQTILDHQHDVVAIVTAPDKPRGRGKQVTFTPIKEFALAHSIKVLQPEAFNDATFIEQLKNLEADLFVVVAFRILPKEIYSMPKFGSFNLHGSLLPKFRGAAPIQWALIKGEKKTGVTTFALAEKVDTGNVYLKKEIPIDDEDDFGSLHDKLSLLGSLAVAETIEMINSQSRQWRHQLLPQDNSMATPAPKITKELCAIVWEKDADDIHNLVRGLSPFPAAFFIHQQKIYKVYKTRVVERNLNPGELFESPSELIFGCEKNSLSILEIQQEGKKRLKIAEFLRGHRFN